MKTKTAVVIGLLVILVAGIVVLVEHKRAASKETKSQAARMTATMERVKQVNISLPDRQTQAKMLMMVAFVQKKIPDAANWCETLNAGGNIWPATPTNTFFALNANMAGRAISRAMNGDTVVFFETANPGWNQAGGAELLAANPDGVAVAFADGRALIVSPAEAANLRWAP
jgi:hypothetical protein